MILSMNSHKRCIHSKGSVSNTAISSPHFAHAYPSILVLFYHQNEFTVYLFGHLFYSEFYGSSSVKFEKKIMKLDSFRKKRFVLLFLASTCSTSITSTKFACKQTSTFKLLLVES